MNILNKKLWGISFLATASLLAVITSARDVTFANEGQINKVLNITTSSGNNNADAIYYQREYTDATELKNHLSSVSKQVEAEGLVLLKNENNALPLSQNDKVSCFFNGSVNFNYATSGSSAADTTSYKTLQTSLTDAGLQINSTLWDYYLNDLASYKRTYKGANYKVNEAGWELYSDSVKATLSEYDNIIVTIARDSGEGKDINTVRADTIDDSYLSLSEDEIEVLTQLTSLKEAGTIKKIIVLLNSSQMIQLDFMEKEGIDIDACLWVGNVGTYGIDSISEALVGKVNPSGRLSDTLLKDNFSSPAMVTWMNNAGGVYSQTYENSDDMDETQRHYGINIEGIYVGYRYYETRYYDYVTQRANTGDYIYSEDVAYPFGDGISYTTFEYSNYSVVENSDNKTYTVSVDVKNTGSVAGKEAVEIYLNKPYTEYDIENDVEKSSVELVGYGKTKSLEPNESETVTIEVEKERFKSYDSNNAKTYILDEGNYHLILARNSHEAVNNLLSYEGYSVSNTSSRMDEDGNSDFVYRIVQTTFDNTTYAVSSHTGKAITNLFDESDINKYSNRGDNQVTYVSRNNWTGTFPTGSVTIALTDGLKADLASNKSYTETETEMPNYSVDNGLTLASLRSDENETIAYDDARWDKLLDQMSFEDQSKLITSAQFSTAAISSVAKPDTYEDDGPTGVSSTTTSTSFPSEGVWASTFNNELIEELGDAFAEDCIMAGKTGIYAGGVNIHRTPFGGRNHEYFSEDPYLSGITSQAEIKGLQSKGVIVHVKHLAFNEEESSRNGIAVWLNEQEAREIYLVPFEYSLAIDKGNGHAAMSGFNRVGAIWAGAHKNMQETLLRDEWGFDGYIITDMASSNGAYYMTYQDGFLNGTDCFLGTGGESALNAYKNSPTFAAKMREACHHILYSVGNFSYAMNGYGANDEVIVTTPWWKVTISAILYTVLALTLITLVLYIVSLINDRKLQSK